MTLLYAAGDFTAFLTAVLETWLNRSPELTILPETAEWFGAIGPRRTVEPDPAAARRIAAGVTAHAGAEAWQTLSEAFRHRGGGKEALLAEFVRLCVRHGRPVLLRLVDSEVRQTLRRARAVRAEAHRFLGLVRFQAVSGGWYGRFEPDHDVLGLLAEPFHRRMLGTDWMLHDAGRTTAWVCRNGVGSLVRGVQIVSVPRESSGTAEELWKRYFKTIAQPTRLNPALQRSKLPFKTWKNLIEEPGRF